MAKRFHRGANCGSTIDNGSVYRGFSDAGIFRSAGNAAGETDARKQPPRNRTHGELRTTCGAKLMRLLEIEPPYQVPLILEILADIALSFQIRYVVSKGYDLPGANETSRWQRISEFVFDNFQRPITGLELAEVADLHPASLARYFKSTVGISPTLYINQVRIGQACRLLMFRDRSILDISLECGFQNLSHFNRCFKSIKKMTPTQFRSKIQTNI